MKSMRKATFHVGDVLTDDAGDRYVIMSDHDFMSAQSDDRRYTLTSIQEWVAYQQDQMRVAGANIDMVKARSMDQTRCTLLR